MSKKADDSSVYKFVFFLFSDKDAAKQNWKDIKSSGVLHDYNIVGRAVVERDEKEKVEIYGQEKGVVGAVIGSMMGILGGPASFLAVGAAAGMAIGGLTGRLDNYFVQEDLEKLGDALSTNTSALLLLLEDEEVDDVIDIMSRYTTSVVTLTAGDDLSSEIAAFLESDIEGPPSPYPIIPVPVSYLVCQEKCGYSKRLRTKPIVIPRCPDCGGELKVQDSPS